jgi:hypothetical protein
MASGGDVPAPQSLAMDVCATCFRAVTAKP